MNSDRPGSSAEPSAARLLQDDEQLLLRLERLTAQLADKIARRRGEDDLSVWQRAEAEIFGTIPDAPD